MPFPVNGSPSARFRKRNVTDVGKPTRTRPEARGADNRTLFRSLLHFHLLILANYLTHSDFTLLAIADGVANSRFIGCLVALFFLQVLPRATMRLPTRSSPVFLSRNQTKRERLYLSLFVWCGQQDLNLHDCSMDPKSIASAISPRPHFLAATFCLIILPFYRLIGGFLSFDYAFFTVIPSDISAS